MAPFCYLSGVECSASARLQPRPSRFQFCPRVRQRTSKIADSCVCGRFSVGDRVWPDPRRPPPNQGKDLLVLLCWRRASQGARGAGSDSVDPGRGGKHLAEQHLLGTENGPLQLLGRDRAGRVRRAPACRWRRSGTRRRSRGGRPGGRSCRSTCASCSRRSTRYRCPAPAATPRAACPVKLPGSVFSISRSRGRAATSGCSSHSWLPLAEDRLVFLEHLVLDDDRRDLRPALASMTFRICSRCPAGWVIGKVAGEVLVLHVDDQQRPFHQHLPTRDLIVTVTLVDLDLTLILPDRLRFPRKPISILSWV